MRRRKVRLRGLRLSPPPGPGRPPTRSLPIRLFFHVSPLGQIHDVEGDLPSVSPALETAKEAFGPLQDAYTTLLLDVMTGDPTLFVHADEVESSWRLYAPLLEPQHEIYPYAAGSWGPVEAGQLIREEEDPWRVL